MLDLFLTFGVFIVDLIISYKYLLLYLILILFTCYLVGHFILKKGVV